MFQVKLNDYILYDYRLDDLEHEDMVIINAKLSLEANKTNSFQFNIYSNHRYFDKIKKMSSIIKVYKKDELIFRGRIFEDSQGFNKSKKVDCEGELAFLLDSIYRPYDLTNQKVSLKQFIIDLINNHNNQVKDFQKIKIGVIDVEDANEKVNFSSETDTKTWKVFEEKIIPTYGGYIYLTHDKDDMPIFNYYKELPHTSSQKIEYGVNLLDINNLISAKDLATACIPRGAKLKDSNGNETSQRLDIKSVNHGQDCLINEEKASEFGIIYADPNLFTFNDVTVASHLLTKATQLLDNCIKLSQTIEIKANYLSAETNINDFRFLYYVYVISLKHGINEKYLLEKLDLDLFNISNTQITLGQVKKTLTDNSLMNRNNANQIIKTIETIKTETMNSEQVTTLIKNQLEISTTNIITLKMPTDINLTTTNETNIPLIKNILLGSKLSVSDGKINIGNNVNYIRISGNIHFLNDISNDSIQANLYKNSDVIISLTEKSTRTLHFIDKIIQVSQKDKICLKIKNETNARGKIDSTSTYLTVEVIS